jgi:deoxyinosine 3'endonuclease (endonuclease V)
MSLDIPYISGYLAFREAPLLIQLWSEMLKEEEGRSHLPQVSYCYGKGKEG